MIKASLTFHTPEHIYHFLKKQIGPLYMIIKNGQAIINFANPQHTNIALKKYHSTHLNGIALQLSPYQDQSFINAPKEREEKRAEVPPAAQENEIELEQPKYSEFTMMIEEQLKVKDPSDWAEPTTKKARKDMIQFIATYNPVLETAQNKRNQLLTMVPEQNNENKVEQFQKYYENGLAGLTKSIKTGFKNFRRSCSKFNERENVELDPNIKIEKNSSMINCDTNSWKTKIQYSCEFNQIKRITALNENQFVCTSHSNKGRAVFFRTDDQFSQLNVEINGAYGLTVLDEHILVGNNQGFVFFLRSPSFTDPEMSMKLHKALIFEIIPHSRAQNNHKILTISIDNTMKLWNINQEEYCKNENTLFFQQLHSIEQKGIYSAVSLEQGQKIAYSHEKYLTLYDYNEKKKESTILCKGTILKMTSLDDHILGLANERYVSFVDLRNNAQTQNIRINKDTRTITAINQFMIFYGCGDGELGVLDRRNTQQKIWYNTTAHKSKIYDVCKVGSYLLSGDHNGQIVSWSPV